MKAQITLNSNLLSKTFLSWNILEKQKKYFFFRSRIFEKSFSNAIFQKKFLPPQIFFHPLILTLFYMKRGNNVIIARQSSMDALNWMIFHDFVPFNIRMILGRSNLEFFFENFKNFCVNDFCWTSIHRGDPST